MEVLKALECIRDYCRSTSISDCNSGKCKIDNALGDCIFSITPEDWELNIEECDK